MYWRSIAMSELCKRCVMRCVSVQCCVRNGPRGARFASFGLGLCIFALIPSETGYQDIASLLARQPGVAERWQKRVFSAAAIHPARDLQFRPSDRHLGAAERRPTCWRVSTSGHRVTGSLTRNPLTQPPPRYQASDFPKVDRTLKGDRLPSRAAARRAGDRPPTSAGPARIPRHPMRR